VGWRDGSKIWWLVAIPNCKEIFLCKFRSYWAYPGWGIDPSYTVKLAKLAVDTGVWALKEAVFGVVSPTVVPKRFKPVEEYLQVQGRFAHLFKPVRQEAALNKIQEGVNEYWNRHKLLL